MSNKDVKEAFLDFIAGGSTGCQFARIAALKHRFGKLDWILQEMAGFPSIDEIGEIYNELFLAKGNTRNCIHTLLLPDVRSGVNLACVTRQLLQTPLFRIEESEMYEGPLFENPINKTSTFVGI